MKLVKLDNILYVINSKAYQITDDTDALIIYVPEKSYLDFVALNPTLLLESYNYNTIKCTNNIEYLKSIKDRYLTIEAITEITVSFSNTIYYSDNWGETWNKLNLSITVLPNKAIIVKSNLIPSDNDGIGTFSITGNYNISGNPLSLIKGDNFKLKLPALEYPNSFLRLFENNTGLISASDLFLSFDVLSSNCFGVMFYGCSALTNAPKISSTTLANSCYRLMFAYCTSLTTPPELPATTLTNSCYGLMFAGCSALTKAPKLPATMLANNCYKLMFGGCTALTTPPELPAITLADSCYGLMFLGAGLLTTPKLPATVLADSCYRLMFENCTSLVKAPELPATGLAANCYNNMFYLCTSLVNAPILSATTLANGCYNYMFGRCTSLVNAPILPAKILKDKCYYSMFKGCSSLLSITIKATDISADSCLYNMLNTVNATGTITKVIGVSYPENVIPEGWTVIEI